MSNVPRIYRMDGPKEIRTDQLFFWPNNPRLKISDFKELNYSEKQLLAPKNQQKVFELLQQEEHSVRDLIDSMSKVGFMREKAPIVMEIKGRKKYLVLEGNRRLTAIRTLLSENSKTLSKSNRESLSRIPCWFFVHTSQTIPLNAAISRMVAEQHLKGQRPHTKIQQAHMLYNAYMGFLLEDTGKKVFNAEADIIERSADFFDMRKDEFKQELAVVRLYKQLTEAGYEVSHKFRERLTWVYNTPMQFQKNFGYQRERLQLDNLGLERYYDIFIREGCAVHSPALFKKFRNVMRYGDKGNIEVLRDDPEQLSQIEQVVMDRNADNRFSAELGRIEKKLNGLKIAEYKKTKDENRLIRRICQLVMGKLKTLTEIEGEDKTAASEEVPPGERGGRKKVPKDIEEALSLDYGFLCAQIQNVLKNRPNGSCVREKLPDYLLKKWGVISHGSPRHQFCNFVEEVESRMVTEGRIEAYRATNDRLRLP